MMATILWETRNNISVLIKERKCTVDIHMKVDLLEKSVAQYVIDKAHHTRKLILTRADFINLTHSKRDMKYSIEENEKMNKETYI